MNATLADESVRHDWIYAAVRPMYVPASWVAGQRVVGDCSKGCQYIARWAEGPDPMGEDFGPYGNSSTLWLRAIEHYDHPSELEVGDFVTFGQDGDEHATVVLEGGSDPLLWSFGHQGSPNSYRLSQDTRPAQFLRYLYDDPAPPPTPQDKLRAKTGWFAWVAWKQGEGAWKHYGKANRKVRPSVPRVIPLSWWRRYVRFLRNRKSGG
jgi:hypothetical protein